MNQQERGDAAVLVAGNADPRATWAAAALVVGIVDAIAFGVLAVVAAVDHAHAPIIETGSVINIVAGPTFPMLAALLLRYRDRHHPVRYDRLAWLFLGLGLLCTATYVVFIYAWHGLHHGAVFTPAAVWIESWLWTSVVPGISLLLLWFPTGDVPGPRWRWAVWAAVAADVFTWLGTAFQPGSNGDFDVHADNPFGSAAAQKVLGPIGDAGHLLLIAAFLAAIASLGVRYRRGDARVRAQLRWLLVAAGIIVVTIATPPIKPIGDLIIAVNVLATMMFPVTLAVALTRAGFALPRVLVYGLLSTLLLVAYAAVVGIADAAFGSRADRAATLVAAGVITVAVAPLRTRLQRSVDRLVYGDRGDPSAALSDFGRRIAGSPGDLLAEVARTVADALHAPYVAVVLAGDTTPTAAVGVPTGAQLKVPLELRGEQVGELLVAPRDRREHYGPRDLALLEDLARHIVVAAHAAALTRDLQRSRESLVIAREEERRRIRRDLHDGLGPALAGVAFGLDAARNTLRKDPESTDADLARLKTELQASISDVRRLVYDLRPPVLDQLGLVPALQEYAARLGERIALDVSVSALQLPPLPAAVEVAAYRIATEALNNVVRHSQARTTRVAFTVSDSLLRLEIADDGVGVPAQREPGAAGVGLAAMAERAAELGGSCRVRPRPGGGTSVVAELPLRAAS
ncbi:MAG: sensor histidine kinase [Acidothermaceae bacterium]